MKIQSTRPFVATSLALLAASPALAQIDFEEDQFYPMGTPNVISVPGDFLTIQEAINSIDAPGDVVLIEDGIYDGFTIDSISATVTARTVGGVVIRSTAAAPEGALVQIVNLDASEIVVIKGLSIKRDAGPSIGLGAADNAGQLWVETVDVDVPEFPELPVAGQSMFWPASVQITDSLDVTLIRCEADGYPPLECPGGTPENRPCAATPALFWDAGAGLQALTMDNCVFEGGRATTFLSAESGFVYDAELTDRVYASSSLFKGGSFEVDGMAGATQQRALTLTTRNSEYWLSSATGSAPVPSSSPSLPGIEIELLGPDGTIHTDGDTAQAGEQCTFIAGSAAELNYGIDYLSVAAMTQDICALAFSAASVPGALFTVPNLPATADVAYPGAGAISIDGSHPFSGVLDPGGLQPAGATVATRTVAFTVNVVNQPFVMYGQSVFVPIDLSQETIGSPTVLIFLPSGY